jgi:hypothetical protein
MFLTYSLWVYINSGAEGVPSIPTCLLRGKLRDGPTKRDALLLESLMPNSYWWSHLRVGPSCLPVSLPLDLSRPPRLRWINFNVCPHCQAHGRPCMLERLNEWGPMISRSDGVNFHLVLGDRPIEYPSERAAGKSDMKSVGFWYVHERNGDSTETVVVILRRPPRGGVALMRHLEIVADQLYEKLRKASSLPCLYEFDGQRLHQVFH